MILIIGSEGSMGKRYQAILRHLGKPFMRHDPKLPGGGNYPDDREFSGFIVATPTDTHLSWIKGLDAFQKPILCEKPLAKNLDEVERILECRSPLSMMMQYAFLIDRHSQGRSSYNYYHHGPDGLVWDCFQIIALANERIELFESSPIWRCILNGKTLSRGEMDQAYVDAVKAWLGGNYISREMLRRWHVKVKDFEKSWNTPQSA